MSGERALAATGIESMGGSKQMMRRRIPGAALLGLLCSLALAGCQAKPLTVEESGWALTIADHYGARAWSRSRTRYLRYDVVVARDGKAPVRFRQILDRGTGDYRFEADASEFGDVVGMRDLPPGRLVSLGNRELRVASVWIGQTLQPPEVHRAVRERLDYDSWWLTFPLDLGATDLHVEDRGPTADGTHHLLVRFPGGIEDEYHLYVDPGTFRIRTTEIVFPDATSERATWSEPVRLNGVTLQLRRRLPDRTLKFENVALTANVRGATLREPEAEMHDAR
jgi:hypothetical protein